MADLAHRLVFPRFELRLPLPYRRNLFGSRLLFGKRSYAVTERTRVRRSDIAAQRLPYEFRPRAVFLLAHALEFARHFGR